MNDKEWYAKLSTMVLEGIEKINNGQPTWENKEKIRQFVAWNKLPGEEKQQKVRKIKERISEALTFVGYGGGIVLGTADAIAWLMFLCGKIRISAPVALLLGAAVLSLIGLIAKIWNDLI